MPQAKSGSEYFECIRESLSGFPIQERRSCAFGSALPAIDVAFGSHTLANRMGRSWQYLSTDVAPPPDFKFYFLDEDTSGYQIPTIPWQSFGFEAQGVLSGLDSEHRRAVWQTGSRSLFLLDLEAKWGMSWTKDANAVPHWESSFPLRYPIAWLGDRYPGMLVHAGAVGNQSGAVLIVGKSGSGKSTTSLSALAHGLDYLGDDYVIVEPGKNPKIHALSTTAKVSANRVEELGLEQSDSYTLGVSDDEDKRVVYLENFRDQIARERPLRAIIHPSISPTGPRIEPMRKIAMLKALAPSTLFQIPVNREALFARLRDVVNSMPCFCFHVGPNLKENAVYLANFLTDLEP